MKKSTRTLLVLGGAGALALLALPEAATDPGPAASESDVTAAPVRLPVAPSGAVMQTVDTAQADTQLRQAAADQGLSYVPGRLLVRPAEGVSLDAVARALGAEIDRPVGASGYAALKVDAGARMDAIDTLQRVGLIESAAPMGLVRGTGNTCSRSQDDRAHSAQWHLDHVRAPSPGQLDLSGVVVAVVDSGVAYSDALTPAPAASLAGSAIIAPYDFVNDDSHAGDDHAHGTHIASIIASDGAVEGVAPGVSLMPLKVLDANNTGDELMLIEALYHAVDHGADIVNLSLAFGEQYAPSPALAEALDAASNAGIVLIGAAGNDGRQSVAYPAAAPQVIAISATTMDADSTSSVPDYANLGPKVDLMAPGGDLTQDANADGIPDGIAAETILPGDPTQTGLFLFAGTSQAAAVASGAAAWLVQSGASGDEVRALLQASSKSRGYAIADGTGVGELDMRKAHKAACLDRLPNFNAHQYSAAVLPYLTESGDEVQPHARISVVDADGSPVKKVTVYANLVGSSTGVLTCTTNKRGLCHVDGPAVSRLDEGDALAWGVSVDTVERRGLSHQPGGLLFVNDAVDAVLAEVGNRAELDEVAFAFFQEQTRQFAESYTVVNMGTGLASSPLGIIATPQALLGGSTSTLSPDAGALDGTGLASSPLGLLRPTLVTFGGTGLASSPLGFLGGFGGGFQTGSLDGSGLASSPLGFLVFNNNPVLPGDLSGSGLASSPLGFTSRGLLDPEVNDADDSLLLSSGTGPGTLSQSTTDFFASGGSVTGGGISGASALVASGAVEVPAGATSLVPSGDGWVALP